MRHHRCRSVEVFPGVCNKIVPMSRADCSTFEECLLRLASRIRSCSLISGDSTSRAPLPGEKENPSRSENVITVDGWLCHASGLAVGPLHLQRIDRLCFAKTKMNCVGVLGIKGITGNNGQKLAFLALNH